MGQNNTCYRLLVVALQLLILPAAAMAERRTALVIGNAAYDAGSLRNPVHDATDIAAALRRLDFEVTLLRDADLRVMQDAIDTFSHQLRQGGAGLFYFAGHGVQVRGENYLIPLRARISREQDVQYEAVPIGRIFGGMEDADNQLNIIILDACRDNPLARQWRSSQRGLAMMQAARGSLIAFATAPGGIASDGSGRNGLYTSQLLQHLATPGLSVEYLFKRVRAGVVEATQGKQIPWESSSLIGDFFFASQAAGRAATVGGPVPPSVPTPAVPTPAGPDPEATMWALIEPSTQVEDITAFLNAYPNGRFAPTARLKLQQLQRLAAQQRERAEAQQKLAAQQQLETKRRQTEEQQRAEAQRLAEQERQQRERAEAEARQRAEAQRREEEQRRAAGAKQREEQAQQAAKNTQASQPSQLARAEPDSKWRGRGSVAVPVATLNGANNTGGPWGRQIPAFRMDLAPVSNREFLEFVKANPAWKKSRIASTSHDGDYLKHWESDETAPSSELDEPVRYVSFYAASAFCTALGRKLPWLNHYRVAANIAGSRDGSASYTTPYTAPNFNFMSAEWTDTWWGLGPDPGKRLPYQYRTVHSNDRGSRNYSPEQEKRYTGRSLGFRCAER